jgi:hypothetical protein
MIKQQTTVIDFHPEFVASTHSDFFLGYTDWGLIYCAAYSGKSLMSKEEETVIKWAKVSGLTSSFFFPSVAEVSLLLPAVLAASGGGAT